MAKSQTDVYDFGPFAGYSHTMLSMVGNQSESRVLLVFTLISTVTNIKGVRASITERQLQKLAIFGDIWCGFCWRAKKIRRWTDSNGYFGNFHRRFLAQKSHQMPQNGTSNSVIDGSVIDAWTYLKLYVKERRALVYLLLRFAIILFPSRESVSIAGW